MKTNAAGLALIKKFETCRLKAFRPTPVDVWTIGWGHTEGVKEGDECTQKQADDWLVEDLALAELAVERRVVVPLNENEFSALVSLVYNIGGGAFRKSTLLYFLNKKDYTGAAFEFKKWNKQDGTALNGLTTRRAEEALLFTKRIEDEPT